MLLQPQKCAVTMLVLLMSGK